MALGAAEYARDRKCGAVVVRHRVAEVFLARRSDRVEACAALGGRLAPFRGRPPFCEQPLEGRVERTLLDFEDVVGRARDVLRDGVAVEWLDGQRLQNQHLQGPLEKI